MQERRVRVPAKDHRKAAFCMRAQREARTRRAEEMDEIKARESRRRNAEKIVAAARGHSDRCSYLHGRTSELEHDVGGIAFALLLLCCERNLIVIIVIIHVHTNFCERWSEAERRRIALAGSIRERAHVTTSLSKTRAVTRPPTPFLALFATKLHHGLFCWNQESGSRRSSSWRPLSG